MKFVISLTVNPSELRKIRKMWAESGDPRNPLSSVLITPVVASPTTLKMIREMKESEVCKEVYFDSGGFYVQQGKISYHELYPMLMEWYLKNPWADWYVLPDNVPTSQDSPEEVERKAYDTVVTSKMFFEELPDSYKDKVIPVVQGHTREQIQRAVEEYVGMGAKYIGFGSFGSLGPKNNINVLTRQSSETLSDLAERTNGFNCNVHVFGIGAPPDLLKLRSHSAICSFDSMGWIRTAAFGQIYLPFTRAYSVTHRSLEKRHLTVEQLEFLKMETRHHCCFCEDFKKLQNSKFHRAMHNLVSLMDTLNALESDDSDYIRKAIRYKNLNNLYQVGVR